MPPKRKKRFHGLYYHSSPPRVLPMNAQAPVETKKKSADDFSIRLSTIRIWMHEKDIGKLTRVLWAGQGNRLRQQASTNPKVKRFLAAVPYVMNSIKDVHQSVVDNSLETLQATMESNVPPTLITCKDSNGLNVIHKAAGLGHTMMLEYLLGIWPDGAHETDMTGKTALHWAASAKNNMRCYTLLTQAGCEEDAMDYKMKTPLYYKQKHNEIERSFLTQVPEAPRVSQDIPVDWEALASDESEDKKKPEIVIPNGRRKSDILGNSVNLLTSRSEANSIENTSEPDLFQGENATEENPEPQPEESESTDDLDQPLENGHLMDSEVDISESDPTSPPKTPEEPANKEEIEQEEDQPESLTEDENVGNAMNDQNNNDVNAVNEAEHEEGDNNVKNGGVGEIDFDDGQMESEEKVKNEEGNKETTQKVEDPENEDHKNQEEEKDAEEKDEEEVKEKSEFDNEKNEDLDKNEKENDEEKTDVTDSIKDSYKASNDDEKPEEKINDEEKEVNVESEEIPTVEKTGENYDNDVDGENESSSPSTEKTQVEEIQSEEIQSRKTPSEGSASEEEPLAEVIGSASQPETQLNEEQSPDLVSHQTPPEEISADELQSENSQPERPQSEKSLTGSHHSDDSNPQKIEENTDEVKIKENNHSKNKESEEKHKETDEDDDDDDQDLEIKPINTPQSPTDENENNPDFDDKMTYDSPTSSMAIEGFVRGDSEDNQVQSESAAYLDDEERYIEAIINSGDMEQLAALVLNGDGKKILNRKSSKADIQAFLTNVPAYMDKISRVHEAARQGTLYQLQAALDRRKFAIAKDENSPCGASPLHVAVLFGHSDIVRYLAGRFPETTSAVDDDGRTALHYAATINDNGHFFNLLSHMGGNPKATDKLGNTAEFYMNDERAKNVLTYRQLLKRFGSEALEDEMLSDQGMVMRPRQINI